MIKKVVGKVDAKEVVFHLNQATEQWETIVPRDLDGTYIIDFWVEDDAGNSSYYATVLFTVDPETLHITVSFMKYRLSPALRGFVLKVSQSWQGEFMERDYDLKQQKNTYQLERRHECELQ